MALAQYWKRFHEEVVHLEDRIQRLPDDCRCGDADAHLEGRCPCCHGHARTGDEESHGVRCSDTIARLRADLALMCEDFKRTAGAIEKASPTRPGLDVRGDVFLAADDLEKLVMAMSRVGEAVVGFRTTCAMSELRQVKRHLAALRAHCVQLDAELRSA